MTYLQSTLNYITNSDTDDRNKLNHSLNTVYNYSQTQWSPELHDVLIYIIKCSIDHQREIYNDILYYNNITLKLNKLDHFKEFITTIMFNLGMLLNNCLITEYTKKAKCISYCRECWDSLLDILDTFQKENLFLYYYSMEEIYEICRVHNFSHLFSEYCKKSDKLIKDVNIIPLINKQLDVATHFRQSFLVNQSTNILESIKAGDGITTVLERGDKIIRDRLLSYISSNPIIPYSNLKNIGITHINHLIDIVECWDYVDILIDPNNKIVTFCVKEIRIKTKNNEVYDRMKSELLHELKSKMENNTIQLHATKRSTDERIENSKHRENMEEKRKEEVVTLIKTDSLRDVLKMKLEHGDELDNQKTEEDIILHAQVMLRRQKTRDKDRHAKEWDKTNWSIKLSYAINLPSIFHRYEEVYKERKDNYSKLQDNFHNEMRDNWSKRKMKQEKLLSFNIPEGKMRTNRDLIIYGLPIIEKLKSDKLIRTIKRRIKETMATDVDAEIEIKLVFNGDKSKEFAFLFHNNALDISNALDDTKLTESSRYVLNTIHGDAIDNVLNLVETYTPPPRIAIDIDENPYNFIDRNACNAFICATDKELTLHTNLYQTIGQKNAVSSDNTLVSDANFTAFDLSGIYMYSIHKNKVTLYSGKLLSPFSYFEIIDVRSVIFSYDSYYIAIYNGYNIYIYDISIHKLIHQLSKCSNSFKFSASGRYFAHYINETLEIVDLHTNKVDILYSIKNWDISPLSDIVVYLKYDDKSKFTSINVSSLNNVKIPTLTKFIVHDTKGTEIILNPNKNEMLIIFNHKNSIFQYYNLDDLSTQVLDIIAKYLQIQWEPMTSRLGLIDAQNRFGILTDSLAEIVYVKTQSVKQMFWSPTGKFVTLSNLLERDNIEIVDTSIMKVISTIQLKHCSRVSWDPTGRFIVLATLRTFSKTQNMCKIYTYQGDLIWERSYITLCHFQWRPTCKKLLEMDKLTDIPEIIGGKKCNSKLGKLLKDIKSQEMELVSASSDTITVEKLRKLREYRSIMNHISITSTI